jgi:TRAP-type transport system periplasmic protein
VKISARFCFVGLKYWWVTKQKLFKGGWTMQAKQMIRFLAVIMVTVSFLIMSGPGSACAANAIELKVLSAWGPEHPAPPVMLVPYINKLNERAKDKLKLTWVGPEAVPPFEQLRPVSQGLFDMGFTHPAYHAGEIAFANGTDLIRGTAKAKRDAGVYKFIDETYRRRVNLVFLAGFPDYAGYHLIMKKKLDKADLKGLKIRTTPFYEPFVRALGGASVTIKTPEIYSALEKGVVDGAAHPVFGVLDYKWFEVSKYLVRPAYGETTYQLFVNADKWNKLPADIQKLMTEVAIEVEAECREVNRMRMEKEEAELKKLGMELNILPPDEAKKYLEVFYQRTWEDVVIKLDAQDGTKLRQLGEKVKAEN